MRVRLIKRKTIEDFVLENSSSTAAFTHWLSIVTHANWEDPSDISKTFGTADLLGNGSNRVVFNISGNKFRMIAKYHFGESQVHLYIKWIGSHAAYSKLCKESKQYSINDY